MRTQSPDTAFAEPEDSTPAWREFVTVVRQLRVQCPWDRTRTHELLRHLLIEEAYETLEAIDTGDFAELKEELGDLLLQAALHSVIAEEAAHFNMKAVLEAATAKLIRRHPHVFGDVEAETSEEVLQKWESFKAAERGNKSVLSGVPANLPALLCAYRMQEKAAGIGFDFPDNDSTWEKVEEEIGEFRAASNEADRVDEFGDLLFALVNYARRAGIEPEMALRATNRRFRSRLGYIESQIDDIGSASLEEMDRYWEASKLTRND